MTGRIGAKGQVVIPKALRDRANLHPGDQVEFELREDEIVLVARRRPASPGGRFARSGMATRLLEDRAREPRCARAWIRGRFSPGWTARSRHLCA